MSVKNEGFLHLEFSMISSLNDSYRTIFSVYGCDPKHYEKKIKEQNIEIEKLEHKIDELTPKKEIKIHDRQR